MRIASSNIRDNPDLPRQKVRRAAAATAKVCGVAFFQEIGEVEDHRDIEQAMGPAWEWVGTHLAVPIAYKAKYWELVDAGHELTHRGLAGTSPDRWINWAVLRRRRRLPTRAKKQRVVAFLNTHFVSGAWNDKDKLNKDWRQRHWDIHYVVMARKILEFAGQGVTVIFGGDFNRLAVPDFCPGQFWLVQHGIDKIGCVPAGARVRVVATGHVDVTHVHDHEAVWASVLISAA